MIFVVCLWAWTLAVSALLAGAVAALAAGARLLDQTDPCAACPRRRTR